MTARPTTVARPGRGHERRGHLARPAGRRRRTSTRGRREAARLVARLDQLRQSRRGGWPPASRPSRSLELGPQPRRRRCRARPSKRTRAIRSSGTSVVAQPHAVAVGLGRRRGCRRSGPAPRGGRWSGARRAMTSGSPTRVSTSASTAASVTGAPAASSRTSVTRRPSKSATSAAAGRRRQQHQTSDQRRAAAGSERHPLAHVERVGAVLVLREDPARACRSARTRAG